MMLLRRRVIMFCPGCERYGRWRTESGLCSTCHGDWLALTRRYVSGLAWRKFQARRTASGRCAA